METNRYEFANLPISKKTAEGISQDGINLLGAIGRMLSLQDDVIEEKFDLILKSLDSLSSKVDRLNTRISSLEKIIKRHDVKINCLEQRIEAVEKILQ